MRRLFQEMVDVVRLRPVGPAACGGGCAHTAQFAVITMNPGEDTKPAEHCPACGQRFGADDRFCGACGAIRPAKPVMPATAVERMRLGWHPASWSAGVIGAIVLAVAAAVAAGAFVAVSSSSGHHSSTPASVAPATQPEPAGEPTPTDSQTETETSSTATTQTETSPPQAAEPLATLNGYWADIQAHNFAGAWAYLAPGAVEMTEEQFISSEQGAHISDVKFHGSVSSNSGGSSIRTARSSRGPR